MIVKTFTDLCVQILVYILNYVDRNALPQARIQGLEEDIGLEGVQYQVCLSILFVGYILMQGMVFILTNSSCASDIR